jgi:ABC-type multidrug transport system ATPase subunit
MGLQLVSVTRRFGEQLALDSVSIHVRPGDCYGFIGHNGAGKTTAMRIALGLQRADSGRVIVDGFDAREYPREARARMGGLIETPGFQPALDASANLTLLARLQGLSTQAARAEVARLLDLVGLAHTGAKPVAVFSQGMRQRLGIAQALLGKPAYVLLDEPTNGLDPQGIAEMREMLRRIQREEGASILISSHQLHELADLCNRVGVMHRGKLVVEALTADLLAASPGRFELATSDDARALALLADLQVGAKSLATGGLELDLGGRTSGEVARKIVGSGLELVRFGARPPSLEEIYLRYARGERILAPVEAKDAPLEVAAPTERRAAPAPIFRTLRYELSRLCARPAVPLLLALPAAAAAGTVLLERSRAAADAARVAAGELASATAITGFGTSAKALATGLPLLALALAGIASQMVAGELARNTLRHVLLRPQTRFEVLAGKALAGLVLLVGSYALLAASALGLSAAFFGFGDLVEILPNGQEFPLVAAEELRPDLQRAVLVPLAALAGYFGLGLFAGTFARAAAAALGLAFGSAFALDLVRGVLRGAGVEGSLLSAYLPSPLGDTSFLHFLADRAQGISNSTFEHGAVVAGFLPQDVGVPLLWALACFSFSVALLARRPIP